MMHQVSIYVSSFALADDHDRDVDGPAPLLYHHSGHRPSAQDLRQGSLELAYIPGFVDGTSSDHEPRAPWLRLSLESTDPSLPNERRRRLDVILDRRQVAALHAYLADWLHNTDQAADLDQR